MIRMILQLIYSKRNLVLFSLLLLVSTSSIGQQSVTDFNPVTAGMIRERLVSSNVKGIYPRLFFSAKDIERIKSLYNSGDPLIQIGYAAAKRNADETLTQPLLKYYLDEASLRVPSIHKFAAQLPPLVMMYKLTGDTLYARRIVDQFTLMSDYPDWGADRHFLDAGIGGFDFALAYDVLYSFTTPEEKRMMKEAVLKHVLLPGKKQLQKNAWWSTASHNWNSICNGGVIMAALAMFEDDPEGMSQIISLALNNLPRYIRSFEPDGQSEEGLMYWGYGLMYTTILFESLQRVVGTAFGLDKQPGFMKTGWFPAYLSGPVTSLSIGDDPIKNTRSLSFFWFAKNNNDSALAKMQYELCKESQTVSWMDMLYYLPEMIQLNTPTREIPLENYIRGIEVMSLRDGWSKLSTFVSMHGGDNFANHGHLDAGSFDIQASGEVWAYGNLGRDDYTYPGYFSKSTLPAYDAADSQQTIPGRWHFYRLRAEGKNCLVFNQSVRPDQNEMGAAVLSAKQADLTKASYTLDLTNCYSRDVSFYTRTIELNKQTSIITVLDSFIANKSSTVWWNMHTKASISIQCNGRSAILKIGDKQLKADIISPEHVVFDVLEATYLPGKTFPKTKNTPNEGFRKLVIKADDLNFGKIQVEFRPIK